jgi:hypothetical protein
MYQRLTYHYHILSSAEGIEEWLKFKSISECVNNEEENARGELSGGWQQLKWRQGSGTDGARSDQATAGDQQIIADYLLKNAHGVVQTSQGHLVTTFARALGDYSVNIVEDAEQDGSIGISYISVRLKNGDITANLAALFEQTSTNARALHACLAWCSTFLAATAVMSLRIISPEVITKLANARFIVWKVCIGDEKKATLLMPKGELEHLTHKAYNLTWGSEEWAMQLVKPTQCYLQLEDGQWSMNRHTLILERTAAGYKKTLA